MSHMIDFQEILTGLEHLCASTDYHTMRDVAAELEAFWNGPADETEDV